MNSQQPPFESPFSSRAEWNQRRNLPGFPEYRPPGDPPNDYWSNNTEDERAWQTFAQPHSNYSSTSTLQRGPVSQDTNVSTFQDHPGPAHFASSPAFAVPISNSKFGLSPGLSRDPTFANILQSKNSIPAPASQEALPARKKSRRPRGPVHHRVNPSDWEKYKAYLKHLYMEKRHTALEIMKHMRSDFNFDASEQQYKNKFAGWGFVKTMPKERLPDKVAQFLLVKKGERELKGKETEFVWENRILPINRVQQLARLANLHGDVMALDHGTPMGLTYSTPAKYEVVPSPHHANIFSPRPLAEPKRPPDPLPELDSHNPLHLRLTWKGYNLADVEEMAREAASLSELGKVEEAEHKYQEALQGFEGLLSSTHEKSISVAYEFAEFYAKNVRMNEADEVLQCVSENIIRTWGLEHAKTIEHMLHVINLYHGWSRSNDALTLMLRAVEYLNDPPAINGSRIRDATNENPAARQRTTAISSLIDTSDFSGSKDGPKSLELRLVLANAQARAKDSGAETVLLGLIEQCEKFPKQFAVQRFKAHSYLIDLYQGQEDVDKLESAMEKAKEFFFLVFKKKRRKREEEQRDTAVSLLRAATNVVEHFVQRTKFKDAEVMFDVVERDITDMLDKDQTDAAIDLLVEIGMIYQIHGQWDYARPRFEYALATTLASRGRDSWMAKKLQDGIEKRSFSMASLPKTGSNSSNSLRRYLGADSR